METPTTVSCLSLLISRTCRLSRMRSLRWEKSLIRPPIRLLSLAYLLSFKYWNFLSAIFVYCHSESKQTLLLTKYSNTASRFVVAVLMLAVSSGFTVAHHACQMEQKQCCDSMPSGGTMDGTSPSQGPSVGSTATSCCVSIVSGGSYNFTALFEKQSKIESQKFTLAPLQSDFVACPSRANVDVQFLTQSSQAASPPSVEKYVLFASLLI